MVEITFGSLYEQQILVHVILLEAKLVIKDRFPTYLSTIQELRF